MAGGAVVDRSSEVTECDAVSETGDKERNLLDVADEGPRVYGWRYEPESGESSGVVPDMGVDGRRPCSSAVSSSDTSNGLIRISGLPGFMEALGRSPRSTSRIGVTLKSASGVDRRLLRINMKMASTIRLKPPTPPTTPPAMAPTATLWLAAAAGAWVGELLVEEVASVSCVNLPNQWVSYSHTQRRVKHSVED